MGVALLLPATRYLTVAKLEESTADDEGCVVCVTTAFLSRTAIKD